ncbi:hypothetical protein [Geobacter sp. SVR]|uniref:hypothetical protein n=1 Tax=Geobacter sp. SVR TaxID=2495594 RepID=UPI00143EFB17|nr:hypothetical protein [Geobacter sp. SVR]BCS54600.1 hypothetical protein GSVR_29080 [Geobacter sp. SVR]GCF86893.1 hypothetical protein GSbR_34930 [Geobacter sp. SVR]
MTTSTVCIPALRRELRAAIGDRSKMSKLHSQLTESINHSYGEERAMLLKLRQELKDALNSRVLDNW